MDILLSAVMNHDTGGMFADVVLGVNRKERMASKQKVTMDILLSAVINHDNM